MARLNLMLSFRRFSLVICSENVCFIQNLTGLNRPLAYYALFELYETAVTVSLVGFKGEWLFWMLVWFGLD